jgi:hypothetical protein
MKKIRLVQGDRFNGDIRVEFGNKPMSYERLGNEGRILAERYGKDVVIKKAGLDKVRIRPTKPMGMSLNQWARSVKECAKNEDRRRVMYPNTKNYQGAKMALRKLRRKIEEF